MTAALEVEGLTVGFGPTPVLRMISFNVAPGERVVVLGASGAGKTTLLRAVAGLLPVAEGRVRVAGRDVSCEPPERRDAVYLHQAALPFPHLSVFENVAFPLRIRRLGTADIRSTVDDLLRAVRLDGLERRMPHTLSGGQRHRMTLARAMAARPAVLLLDEPLASLDPSLREEVRGTVIELQARHSAAVLMVTHDLEEAAALGHRIGVMLEGTLAQIESPEVLFRRPASLAVARFLGIPNEVKGRVAAGRFESALGCLQTTRADGEAIGVFGVDALRTGADGVEARVVALRYGRARVIATVEVGGLMLSYAPPPDSVPSPGQVVRLSLLAGQVALCSDLSHA